MGICEDYFRTSRRHVYQTPKSFLSLMGTYRRFYTSKLETITEKERRITMGPWRL